MYFLPFRPELCCLAIPNNAPTQLDIMVSAQTAQRMPFSIAQSHGQAVFTAATLRAASNVHFSISTGFLQRKFQVSGPVYHLEDLRLSSHWQSKTEYFGILLQSKLPNTSDSLLVGTDETDWSGMAFAQLPQPNYRIMIGAGLAIWGDPNRFASQDDALLFIGQYSAIKAAWQLDIGIGGHAFSPQNPSQASLVTGLKFGACHRLKTAANVGLTAFAPRFGFSLAGEYRPRACTSQLSD